MVAQMLKNLPAMQETWVRFWVGKIPQRKEWRSTPAFFLENFIDRGSHALQSMEQGGSLVLIQALLRW